MIVNSYELGVRGSVDRFRGSLVGFVSTSEDGVTFDPATNSISQQKEIIWGAEFTGEVDVTEKLRLGTFLAYREGRIPRGVSLPTNPPMICWDRETVEVWIQHGCPRDPWHAAHEKIVLQRLLDCVRQQLSSHPPTLVERTISSSPAK